MISNIKGVVARVNPLVAAATLILAAMIPVLSAQRASALALVDRSLMVSSTVPSDNDDAPDGSTYVFGGGGGAQIPAGDGRNGTKVSHRYEFTPQSTSATVRAFTISYCHTAFGYVNLSSDCTLPAGFSAAGWNTKTISVGGQNFTAAWSAANKTLTLTNSTGISAGSPLTLNFPATETDFFVNPTTAYIGGGAGQNPSGTYFAHVTLYSSDSTINGTTLIDEGTVTNSVAQSISIYTRVQETLNFSVEGEGGTGDATTGPTSTFADPDTDACSPLTANSLLYIGDANDALETGQAHTGKSYFRLATNSANGVTVYYSGDTLRSGGNYALDTMGSGGPPLTTAATSVPGTEQFGMAFDTGDAALNASINVVGDDSVLIPATPYDDKSTGYAFDATSTTVPRPLASAPGVVQCDTGGLEYIANISADTPAGIYTTKINYIASPSY